MQHKNIEKIIRIFKKQVGAMKLTALGVIAESSRDPFRILIACLLSLRTKDETTHFASMRLFKCASSPKAMLRLTASKIEKLIYPVGFYRTKAINILEISKTLINKHKGKVPSSMEGLLEFKGVGRKTANLVLTLGFDQYGICVDVHVHRISNRLGWIKTKSPEETEYALMKILPKKYWKTINDILVTYGQNVCKPVSPYCSKCLVQTYCKKVGVLRQR